MNIKEYKKASAFFSRFRPIPFSHKIPKRWSPHIITPDEMVWLTNEYTRNFDKLKLTKNGNIAKTETFKGGWYLDDSSSSIELLFVNDNKM